MFCPNCGYDCKDANFCPNCGTSLKEIKMPAAAQDPASIADEKAEQMVLPLDEPYYQKINGYPIDLHRLIRTYGNGMRKRGAFVFLVDNYGVTEAQAKEILEPLYQAHAGEKITLADGLKAQMILQQEAAQAKAACKKRKQEAAQKKEACQKQEREKAESGEYTKICLNCGDRLLAAAEKCPTCGNKKNFVLLPKEDVEAIHRAQAEVPHPKEEMEAKWKTSTSIQLSAEKAQKTIRKQQIKENRAKGIVCCPKCGSTSVTAQKKGFSFVKGAIGATISLDVGLIAGGAGANKVILTCMNCGHQWEPGKK